MVRVDAQSDKKWLAKVVKALEESGVCVVEKVLSDSFVDHTRNAMYSTQEKIFSEVGKERLECAGESGVLRLMMKFDPFFIKLLEIPEILETVDSTVSETAIVHLQNGIIWPALGEGDAEKLFNPATIETFPGI